MTGGWIRDALGFDSARWLNIHAGLDEFTPVLRALFGSGGRTFDIFDEKTMTAPSIARARRERLPDAAGRVDPCHLPQPSNSVDAAFLLLAAHELRTHNARVALFREIRRVLNETGGAILAEHLRDVPNFAAFGPGAAHFHSRRTWRRCIEESGLRIRREFTVTPFVHVFVLGRQP
jgi:SAM-dependent methyltransferase